MSPSCRELECSKGLNNHTKNICTVLVLLQDFLHSILINLRKKNNTFINLFNISRFRQ